MSGYFFLCCGGERVFSPAGPGPYMVILARPGSKEADQVCAAAKAAGRRVMQANLFGARTDEELAGFLGRDLYFPYRALGLDAALDLMSDDDWFTTEVGHLLVVHGLDDVMAFAPKPFDGLIEVLAALGDRWSAVSRPYDTLLLVEAPAAIRAVAILEDWNDGTRQSPWMRDVLPVVVRNLVQSGPDEQARPC